MKLGDIVKELRAANGWSLEKVAARVSKHHGKKIPHQSIQQLEKKPDTKPHYGLALAAAFEKTVEDLYAWRPGMPTLGANSLRHSQPAVSSGDILQRMEQMAADQKHEIDQLHVVLLSAIDVLTSKTPDTAGALLNRVKLIQQTYAERGHAEARYLSLVVGTLQNIVTSNLVPNSARLPGAARAPSRRKPSS